MQRHSYGPTVDDGIVQYFSASSLTLGDPNTAEGCLRRWWYEKVAHRRPPPSDAQEFGTQLHSEIETFLRTGQNTLGPLAIRGKPMLPVPGPDLLIEHDLLIPYAAEMQARDAETKGDATRAAQLRITMTSTAPLRIRGIPLVGYIDVLHRRGTNKGVTDIEDIHDPPGTVEVIDWKTTSNPRYIKTPDAMAQTLQMSIYGKWALTQLPDVSFVRLSHGYFITRGTALPRKVTQRVPREKIDQQWERVTSVAGYIVDAAKATDPDKVPANVRACGAYGGCPHRGYCRGAAQESLNSFFGPDGAELMLRRHDNVVALPTRKPLLGAKKPDPAVQSEMFRVAREEIETKYPGIPAAWDELVACNMGRPMFCGELARVVAELSGLGVNVTDLAGLGDLGGFGPFSEPTELPGIVAEVKAFMVTKLLPPDAPLSDPALASVSPDPFAPKEPKRRGRPPKKSAQDTMIVYEPASGQAVDMASGQSVMAFAASVPEPNPALAKDIIHFYVNCRPSCAYTDFWAYVHELLKDLQQAAGDAVDFRLVPQDHKFSFGRWKAAITAALGTCNLTSGHYVLDHVGGEIGLAVAEAMRLVVMERGGIFVQ